MMVFALQTLKKGEQIMNDNLSYCGLCGKTLTDDSGKYVVRNNIGNKIIVCFNCFQKRVNENNKGESK